MRGCSWGMLYRDPLGRVERLLCQGGWVYASWLWLRRLTGVSIGVPWDFDLFLRLFPCFRLAAVSLGAHPLEGISNARSLSGQSGRRQRVPGHGLRLTLVAFFIADNRKNVNRFRTRVGRGRISVARRDLTYEISSGAIITWRGSCACPLPKTYLGSRPRRRTRILSVNGRNWPKPEWRLSG